ncbi:MAG: molybdate ABC transporter permease subunit, partial [Sedimentibacter sp.]|nr:molybdate ABC transporter permease subunit [Sedimentibacter sp.]
MDWSPMLISLKTASASIVITFFLGIFAAKLVVGMKSDKARIFIDGVLTLPLVLPPTVLGFFILLVLGVKRPLGRFLLEFFSVKIVFSWTATVVAAVVVSF